MTMTDVFWYQPLCVTFQNGAERLFMGVHDALDFLENEWPMRKGIHYQKAISQCEAALRRTVSGDVAREAFVAACVEAALPCKSGNIASLRQSGRGIHVAA